MTDAPEKIWAMAPHIGEYFSDPPVSPEDKFYLKEYVRADIHEALEAENKQLREALDGWSVIAVNLQDVLDKAPVLEDKG